MRSNGEAITGNTRCPLDRPTWGRCTARRAGAGPARPYFHVFDWPADGKLTLPALPAGDEVITARLLAANKRLLMIQSRRRPGPRRCCRCPPARPIRCRRRLSSPCAARDARPH